MFAENVILFTAGTSLGGAELFQLEILRVLKSLGVNVYLVASNKGSLYSRYEDLTSDQLLVPFPYPSKPASWLNYLKFIFKAKKFLRKIKGTKVILVGDLYPLWAAIKIKRSLDLRLYSLWQSEYNFSNTSCADKWIRYGAIQADKLIASQPIVDHLSDNGKLKDKLYVLNPRIDLKRFEPSLYQKNKIRETLGLRASDRVAICVGQIGEGKGQPWLVQAFISSPELYNNWKLLIVGPINKGEEDSFNKSLSQDSLGHVRYLGIRSDIPELYAVSDLAIFPGSANESYGMALLEACLMELPVLALGVGAIVYNLPKQYPGLFPLANKEAILNAWSEVSAESLSALVMQLHFTVELMKKRENEWIENLKIIFKSHGE